MSVPLLAPVLALYELTPALGFLPLTPPSRSLQEPYFRPWLEIANSIPALVRTSSVRAAVRNLPVLDASRLKSQEDLQRAHSVLSFLAHAYVWADNNVAFTVPPPISIPFLSISQTLDIPPVATFADTVLWNFECASGSDLGDPANLRPLLTFTGLPDEGWFYMISVAIEARGAPCIAQGLIALDAAARNDTSAVSGALTLLSECLGVITLLVDRMYEECDPQLYYRFVRPFLAGWGSVKLPDSDLAHGVLFDTGDSNTSCMANFSGGSNAQSSLIQFIDACLGVDHHSQHKMKLRTRPAPGPYLLEMRSYMPLLHRRLIQDIEKASNLRDYVQIRPHDLDLVSSYDRCIVALTVLRDHHLKLASRYIILEARFESARLNGLGSSGFIHSTQGTGGTNTIPFLMQTRVDTVKTKVMNKRSKQKDTRIMKV